MDFLISVPLILTRGKAKGRKFKQIFIRNPTKRYTDKVAEFLLLNG